MTLNIVYRYEIEILTKLSKGGYSSCTCIINQLLSLRNEILSVKGGDKINYVTL